MNEGCGIPGGESVKVWITAFRMETRDETDGRFKAASRPPGKNCVQPLIDFDSSSYCAKSGCPVETRRGTCPFDFAHLTLALPAWHR